MVRARAVEATMDSGGVEIIPARDYGGLRHYLVWLSTEGKDRCLAWPVVAWSMTLKTLPSQRSYAVRGVPLACTDVSGVSGPDGDMILVLATDGHQAICRARDGDDGDTWPVAAGVRPPAP